MAKGLLEIQEAEYRRMAALRSAEASYREKQALREAAFAKEETPYAYMNFSMGPPQPENPGLMGGPQYQSSDLPSGMTPEDVQKMFDYQRQAGTQEITAVPYNVGFRPGQPPTLLNQQQMPGAPIPRQLMQSSNAQLIGATPPTLPGKQQISIPGASPRPEFSAGMLRGTQPIDSGQGRFNNNIPNQFGRSASPPVSITRQQPTLSGKTLQPLSDYASMEPSGLMARPTLEQIQEQIPAQVPLPGEINQQQQDEGWSATAYPDRTNVDAETGRESRLTIGYGFNMDQEGAERIVRAAGITHSWADLRSGDASITREEGRAIQNQMQPTFRNSAMNFAGPATWRLMTNDQKNALINVVSNVGPGTLRTFQRMQDALHENPPNFVEAARQLVTTGNGPSPFARQVGDRAIRVSTRLAGTP